jgi:hypothetical protein
LTADPNATRGATNVTAYFSNGTIALAPDAFSYGPQIQAVLPNAGSGAGGDSVTIYGYGFGEGPSKLAIAFGANNAAVQKIEDVTAVGASLGLDATYPFLASFTILRGGVDILDEHTGRLRMRMMLPEPFAMLAADIDGFHGKFIVIDENGERLFALTASGLTVVQLAQVPLGFGTVSPSSASAGSSSSVTIRGSGLQTGVTVTLGGKSAATSFVDMSTLQSLCANRVEYRSAAPHHQHPRRRNHLCRWRL